MAKEFCFLIGIFLNLLKESVTEHYIPNDDKWTWFEAVTACSADDTILSTTNLDNTSLKQDLSIGNTGRLRTAYAWIGLYKTKSGNQMIVGSDEVNKENISKCGVLQLVQKGGHRYYYMKYLNCKMKYHALCQAKTNVETIVAGNMIRLHTSIPVNITTEATSVHSVHTVASPSPEPEQTQVIVIALACGCGVLAITCVLIVVICCHRKRRRKRTSDIAQEGDANNYYEQVDTPPVKGKTNYLKKLKITSQYSTPKDDINANTGSREKTVLQYTYSKPVDCINSDDNQGKPYTFVQPYDAIEFSDGPDNSYAECGIEGV